MKGFFWGLVLGAVLAFFAGMNVGKDKPILSNPFAEKPLMEQIKDTANRAAEEVKKSAQKAGEDASRAAQEASEQVKRTTEEAVEKARQAVHDASQPSAEQNK